ncbi:MAG: hypothetical protein ACRCUJ_13905 [Phocaeicola sp.]
MEEKLVKVQLMSGNAEFNFFTGNDYVDELDLGIVEIYYRGVGTFYTYPYSDNTKMYPPSDDEDGIYLPVRVKARDDNSGYTRYNNFRYFLDYFEISTGHKLLENSLQPYLVGAIRRLVEFYGYTIKSNYMLSTWLKHIYIVNGCRENQKVSKCFPHWTVPELISEVEKALCLLFVIDQDDKIISIVDANDYFDSGIYELHPIMDDYQVDINDDQEEKDVTSGNLQYELPSNSEGGYDRLALNVLENATRREYGSYDAMVSAWQAMSTADKNDTLFIYDGRYFINYKKDNETTQVLRNVNLYGDLIRNPESEEYSTLKIVPAKVEKEEFKFYNKKSIGQEQIDTISLNVPYANDAMTYKNSATQINIQSVIEGEEQIYEKPVKGIMEIAIHTGVPKKIAIQGSSYIYEFPIPFTDYTQVTDGQQSEHEKYSLCLYDQVTECSIGKRLSEMTHINSNVEYTFYFQSNVVPPVNKVFLIKNQRYLAKMFKLTLSNKKVNPIIEGVFYRLE